MTILDCLKEARQLISDPNHWTQWRPAEDKRGDCCESSSSVAVKWCAFGAVRKFSIGKIDIEKIILVLNRYCPGGYIIEFNDHHTHAEVLSIFDIAISKLEEDYVKSV